MTSVPSRPLASALENTVFGTSAIDTGAIDLVLRRLDAVIDWSLQRGSPLGYFAAMYRRMTQGVKDEVLAGHFEDGSRMVRFDALFAEYYFRAFEDFRSGGAVPGPWQIALGRQSTHRTLILQDLLLGMNAHINFDLGLTVVEVAAGTPLERLRTDYDRINAVLALQLDKVQDSLDRVSPAMSWLDRLGRQSDEALFQFSLVEARAGAWRFAERLAADAPSLRPERIAVRDEVISEFGRAIARPSFPLSWAVRAASLLETRDVRRVIEVMRQG